MVILLTWRPLRCPRTPQAPPVDWATAPLPAAWASVYRAGMVGLSQRPAVISSGNSAPRHSGPGPSPPWALTGVCKNEIIATNRPRHPWIPAYVGMTEWAR